MGGWVLGYPLVHANSSRRRRAAAGGGRAVGQQDVHRSRGADPHAQGARAASSASDPPQHLPGARRHLVRGGARRVLRDRRAQRQRQEHAAEVPRRDLPGRGRHLVPRPAVDVDRAGRRLQPGHGGARQRRDERDHARPLAAGGAQALRERDRVRRARGVQGPQAQELLVRHARPPGVLGGDPGRRRHPDDRRGARRRRRRLPAEVLRRLQRAARPRQDDHLRHPRHGRAAAVLSPRAAARARQSGVHGRAARGRRPLSGAQLRPRSRIRRSAATTGTPATARRG